MPFLIRWPGKVPAGKVENGMISGMDWFPTFLAAAGNPNIIEELKKEALVPPTTEAVPEQVPKLVAAAPEAPLKHFEVRFEVLSLDGRSLYQHTEGLL